MISPRAIALIVALAAASGIVRAQTDEIQVYDASIAERHQVTLTFHTNYVAQGLAQPAFPGAVVADQSLNGAMEWAYGVADWFEAGLYFPVWSRDASSGLGYDGFKLRALFVSPHADARAFAYGVNFEFSVNQPRWSSSHYGGEIRGILAWHVAAMDLIVNPIVDTDFNGLANLEFVPCWRVAYNANKTWAVAVEQYADFGAVSDLDSWSQQSHQLFAVVDRHWTRWDAEFGVGYGLTGASDPWTIKLIIETSLTKSDRN
jgi:hypothetical protein